MTREDKQHTETHTQRPTLGRPEEPPCPGLDGYVVRHLSTPDRVPSVPLLSGQLEWSSEWRELLVLCVRVFEAKR